MKISAHTPEQYLEQIPEWGKPAFIKLRDEILKNLPIGFVETISYGMIAYVVPHSIYPAGYHCNPEIPLPFLSIAVQKNFIALYHMGIYADKTLLDWFVHEYPKHSKAKLDMGKSCIRFKNPEQIPFDLIGELVGKISPQQWIVQYESAFKR